MLTTFQSEHLSQTSVQTVERSWNETLRCWNNKRWFVFEINAKW